MTYVDRLLTTTPPAVAGHSAISRDIGCPDLAPLLSVLFLMMEETRSLVINITSPHAGAGVSTVARRLAAAAAATDWCRVAMVDARPGRDESERGLVEAIEQGESPALTPRKVGGRTIECGRLSTAGRPVSRIESVRRVYGGLRDRYSLVVVDCPAVFAGQQTLMVAAAADDTVMVVEAERTAMTDVARARAALERHGAGVLGMVMNKSRTRVPAMFGGNG